ncbi:DUF4123 domain-containing protein [uncultured Massilia sp.]|uniref:DUF4123 domain-containing protein n=1 Tax=uncultured Massilia sp. TaxID=169973 RepID=UPI0025F653A9|nr:DUF4123 domain-containing protein [uncultured Massilia sp.]
MNDMIMQSLDALLWPGNAGRHVHWVMDGARDPAIAGLVRASGLEHACLFSGPLHPRLEAAAPYLVRLPPDAPATAQLLRRGWGQSWGILASAGAGVPFDTLRLHLKKFLRVKTEDGRTLAFRYYDPRVLNVFLPTCTSEEFRDFLGPMAALLAETDGGAGVRAFDLEDDAMRVKDHPLQPEDAPC